MHIKYIAPITAAVALMGTSAMAQETGGWYVQGDLGGSTGGQMDADAPIDLDSGWVVGGSGGYAFNNGVRVGGELLYMKNDLDSVSEGDSEMLGAFANVAYEFNKKGRLRPFVGVGVGVAQVNYDDGVVDDDDMGFAYQAKDGDSYDINERMTAEMAYRYVAVTDLEFGAGSASPVSGDYDNQAVTVGLRYKLGY